MRRLSFVLCLGGLLIGSAPAFAQTITGDIVGTVSDDTGAVLPGVTVTLTGERVAGTFTSITTGRGFYRFNRLHPGSYDLTFSMDGFAPRKRTGLRVALGGTTEENVNLSVGSMEEQLTVIAESLLVDATDTGVSNNFDNNMVENLPLQRDSIYDLMKLAPGVATANEGGSLMMMGSETDANLFLLDGVSLNTASAGNSWATPNTDIIEEVEIVALGAPAEYGHAPGAVFNVVTKQGTNRFHGAASFYYRSDGLMGRNTTDDFDNGNPAAVENWRDFTAQLGGPIVKDKLHFFAAFADKVDNQTQAGIPKEFPQVHQYKLFFGKLNWQINSDHKVQLSFNLDDFRTERNAAPDVDPETQKTFWGKTPAPSLSYTGLLADNTMLEVRLAGFYGNIHSSPKNHERRDGPYYYNYAYGGDCSVGPCLITGGSNYWYDFNETSINLNANISHYADDWLGGSHEFKFGVQYSRAGRENAIVGYTDYFTLYVDDNGDEYVTGVDYQPFAYGGLGHQTAVFFDDTFRVSDRLTLRLGGRYERERGSIPELPFVDIAGIPTGETTAAVDSLYEFNNFSPRLGFTYSLAEDGKTLLRGHFGRYHRGMLTMDFAGGNGNIGTTDTPGFLGAYDVEGWHNQTLEGDGRGLAFGGAQNVAMDPNVKSGYTDQFVLGLERELGANLALSVTYMHKRGNNFPGWQDVGGEYESFDTVEPITGTPLTLSRLTNDPDDRFFLLGSPDGLDTKVNAGALVLNKRMSDGWQLTSSLQLLRSTGAMASQRSGNGWGRQRGGDPWGGFGKNPNDYVNIGGRLIGDVPVIFKTQVMVELPKGFLLGANYLYHQAGTWTPTARINTGLRNDTILIKERDGTDRWENRSLLDLRVQWSARLGGDARLTLIADTLNVFNNDAAQRVRTTRVGSSELGGPRNIVKPRRLQLGAKIQF